MPFPRHGTHMIPRRSSKPSPDPTLETQKLKYSVGISRTEYPYCSQEEGMYTITGMLGNKFSPATQEQNKRNLD